MKIWGNEINLTEPIDVSYENNRFYIEDGHHRYYAAKILNKPLNVNLEIKMNPITKLAPSLSYDDFHRCIFKQVMEQ
jgi:ParB-like chromosome segregation protein Spo0J